MATCWPAKWENDVATGRHSNGRANYYFTTARAKKDVINAASRGIHCLIWRLQSHYWENVEIVRTYKYLRFELDDKLDRFYFLRRLGSFNIWRKLLLSFYSCQHALLCSGVLGRQHQEKRCAAWISWSGGPDHWSDWSWTL